MPKQMKNKTQKQNSLKISLEAVGSALCIAVTFLAYSILSKASDKSSQIATALVEQNLFGWGWGPTYSFVRGGAENQ